MAADDFGSDIHELWNRRTMKIDVRLKMLMESGATLIFTSTSHRLPKTSYTEIVEL